MKKQPYPNINFKKGTPLLPKANLLKWLNQHQGQLLKIPTVVLINNDKFPPIQSVVIGIGPNISETEKITLHIQDTRMGIAFDTYVRMYWDKQQNFCRIWLEGFWKEESLLPFEIDTTKETYPFTVYRVTPYNDTIEDNEQVAIWLEE